MPYFLANLLDWRTDNNMQTNASKTKEIILSLLSKITIHPITITRGTTEIDD